MIQPKQLILTGAFLTAAGLAAAGTAPVMGTATAGRVEAQQTTGGVIVVVGWGLLALGIHRFGRQSEDDERSPTDGSA